HAGWPPSPARILNHKLRLMGIPYDSICSENALPFVNMSGDPGQEYFSDGIAEDIITGLSRYNELVVTARHSSFAFKGLSVTITEAASQLGVQYVLEGSVQKAANRVRITAQLIEGATGSHLWAESYDRVLEDVFAVRDDVVSTIVSTLAGRRVIAESW
ncbi:MAG: hypothetical protein KAR22_24935, partial [Gammaproteobacteria bacterium]|nr:hypothetical protein [Gammaproteobacteria bacterium]